MSPEQRIGEAVRASQNDGVEPREIAAILISWAARYALALGWSAELVADAQRESLRLHVDAVQKGSSRS